jgi:hypothetical protein
VVFHPQNPRQKMLLLVDLKLSSGGTTALLLHLV